MLKTLQNVYELLNQYLHNLCNNEHKNLHVKNLRVHIYNIFIYYRYEQQYILHFIR